MPLPFLIFISCSALSAEPAAKEPPKPETPLATHEVTPEPFAVELKLDGIFEATVMHPISLQPKAWGTMVVVEALAHGSPAKKGDVIVRLDTAALEEHIADIKDQAKIAELTHQIATREFAFTERMAEFTREFAERNKRIVDEDTKHYREVTRPWDEEKTKRSVKWMEDRLAYEMEELRQLEKMYNEDDLTEETEEIILKRQRDYVERMKFSIESMKVDRDQTLNYQIPRSAERVELTKRQQDVEWEKHQLLFPLQREKARLESQRRDFARAKTIERLEKLESDLKNMTVRAPADGFVFYGPCVRGQWPLVATMEGKLRPGGKLAPHEVFATLVVPGEMSIKTEVAESSVRSLSKGTEGRATLKSAPDTEFKIKVEAIASIAKSGKYETTVSPTGLPNWVTPGMGCKLIIVTRKDAKALTVPDKTVHYDAFNDGRSFVYLLKDDGGHIKQVVKVGKRTGGKTEILSGLTAGQKVLIKDPTDKDAK